jgi:hypothetical protein
MGAVTGVRPHRGRACPDDRDQPLKALVFAGSVYIIGGSLDQVGPGVGLIL